MRIIAGRSRGRVLEGPRDDRVRPTSDRARETLFAMLEYGLPTLRGARFLDLFAGTGAVGLEALSRGAAFVLAIERDPEAARLVRANAGRTGAGADHRLTVGDAARLGPAAAPFDIAFLDPPYRLDLARPALESLRRGGWLVPDALVVTERAADEALPPFEGFVLERERRVGAAVFAFLRPGRSAA